MSTDLEKHFDDGVPLVQYNNTMPHLFAFYLGGKAKGAHIEVHDVVLAVGENKEDCYEYLKLQWFGESTKVHIDAYIQLDNADGHKVHLSKKKSGLEREKRLYFVYLGGSIDGDFTEHHKSGFIVAGSQMGAMSRAKAQFNFAADDKHVDNVFEVDNCFAVDSVSGWFVSLEKHDDSSVRTSPAQTSYIFLK